jgi:hypothetical protein
MDEFRTIAKIWPDGTALDLGTDETNLALHAGDSASFTRTAPPFVSSSDGEHTYEFLFWNTGRHLTNKRTVIWNFSVFGWGIWTATRWYGSPGNGPPGEPRVHADPFALGGDAVLSTNTPIDGGASTFAAGAWPFHGNDHEIGTADGAATVVADSTMSGEDFAGWVQYMWGGDPSGDFVETDTGTSGSFGSSSFFTPVPAGTHPFAAAHDGSYDLLATYAPPAGPRVPWQVLVGEALANSVVKIPLGGDPGPEDVIRLAVLGELLQLTRPGSTGGSISDFQGVIEAAPSMSHAELTRTKQALQTTMDLAKSALGAVETRLKTR